MRVRPASVDELVDVMLTAGAERRSAAIAGSESEFTAVPAPSVDLVVEMGGFDGVVDHQPDDLTVTVRSGTTLADLASELDLHGQTAILPATAPARTVGGVVAAGISGYRRLRYGPTRDRVIGIQLVTGYGVAVRGGGRLVKNVTGYDLARLVTGSRGALGAITEITFKLWPEARMSATVSVDDAPSAMARVFRPTAAVETHSGSFVFLEGSERSVAAAADTLGGDVMQGHHWPEPPPEPVVLSIRIPPRLIRAVLPALHGWDPSSWLVQHGVGVIDVGFEQLDAEILGAIRAQAASWGGAVVVQRWPLDVSLTDRFGPRPDSAGIEDRLCDLFDPHGVLRASSRWVLD